MTDPLPFTELAALEATRLSRLRDLRLTGKIFLALIFFIVVWHMAVDSRLEDQFEIPRLLFTLFLGFASALCALLILTAGVSFILASYRFAELRHMQATAGSHHDLPPGLVASLAGKTWQWRILRNSGIVMILSFGTAARMLQSLTSGWEFVALILISSGLCFLIAAMRFIGHARQAARYTHPRDR